MVLHERSAFSVYMIKADLAEICRSMTDIVRKGMRLVVSKAATESAQQSYVFIGAWLWCKNTRTADHSKSFSLGWLEMSITQN